MKKNKRYLFLCWTVYVLVFFTIVVLPMMMTNTSLSVIQDQNIPIRVFYSLLLCIPYFRAVQFYSNNPDFIMENKLSYAKYKESGNIWAYYTDKFVYTTGVVMVFFFALQDLFAHLVIYHYLSMILYGISVLLVEIGIGHN